MFIARRGFASQWLVNRQSIRAACIQTNLDAGSHLAIGKGERLIVIGGWEEFMYKRETYASESKRGNLEINAEVIDGSHPIPSTTPCYCVCVLMHL